MGQHCTQCIYFPPFFQGELGTFRLLYKDPPSAAKPDGFSRWERDQDMILDDEASLRAQQIGSNDVVHLIFKVRSKNPAFGCWWNTNLWIFWLDLRKKVWKRPENDPSPDRLVFFVEVLRSFAGIGTKFGFFRVNCLVPKVSFELVNAISRTKSLMLMRRLGWKMLKVKPGETVWTQPRINSAKAEPYSHEIATIQCRWNLMIWRRCTWITRQLWKKWSKIGSFPD